MKFLLDLLPVILFFVAFKVADGNADAAAAFATQHFGFLVKGGVVGPEEAPVLLATLVVIVATLAQVALTLLARKKVDKMLWITFVLVTVLGGATVWFHDKTFIQWKPSILYWVMALAFWISDLLLGKNLLRALLGNQFDLADADWRKLSHAWALFFAAMGFLNLWVAMNYSTSTWASFKLFGITGLTLVFMIAQGWYVTRADRTPIPAKRSDDAT